MPVAFPSLAAALLGGILPFFGDDVLTGSLPREAEGDIPFHVDAARFLEDGRPVLELALSIPERAVLSETDTAHIEITVDLLDSDRASRASFSTRMALPPELPVPDARPGFPVPQRWIRLTTPWSENAAGVRVRIEDLDRLKRGLWDQIRGNPRSGVVEARIREPAEAPGPEAPAVASDLLFAWGSAASAEVPPDGTGLRGVRSRLDPNPYRFYGLYQPVLTVYWERYPDDRFGHVGSWIVRHRIVRLADSLSVHTTADTFAVPVEPGWSVRRFDLADLAGGSYLHILSLEDAGRPGHPLLERRGKFEVVRERSNWIFKEADLLLLARALLPADAYAEFEALDRGEMEAYLRRLWERHAPTPAGETNPREAEFIRRARHAAQYYSGLRSGIESDRGRVYIRFGPPDEVHKELNPQDRDLLWLVLPGEIAESGIDDEDLASRMTARRTPLDNRAYEIWEYMMRGDPLLPEYANPGQKVGLKFIFVDEMGTGDFNLIYSNVELQ